MIQRLKKIFGREEFYAVSPLSPEETGAVLRNVCLRNTTFPHVSGLTGKIYGASFEVYFLYSMRFRGTGNPHTAWLDGHYSPGNGPGTRIHFYLNPNPGFGLPAVVFAAQSVVGILSGTIWSVYTQNPTSLGIAFGGIATLVAIPGGLALFAQQAKKSLKTEFTRLLKLTSE